jgi:tetratricopeptide (TPR) repeat protein
MGWSFVYYYFPPNSNKILIIVAKFDEDQKVNLRRTILSEINNIKDRFPEVEMMSCGTEECNKEYKVEEKGAEKAVEFGKQQLREEGLQKGLIIWGYYKNEKKGKIFINRFNLSPEDIELKSEIKFEGILAKSDVQLEIEDKISESMAYFIVLLAGIAQYESGNYVEAIDRFNDAEKRNAVPDELVDSKYLYYFRGNAFTYVHRYLEAVSDFTKAIKNPITNVESNFAEAYNNRALALILLG